MNRPDHKKRLRRRFFLISISSYCNSAVGQELSLDKTEGSLSEEDHISKKTIRLIFSFYRVIVKRFDF